MLAPVRRSGSCLGQFYWNAFRRFSIDDSDPNLREFSFKQTWMNALHMSAFGGKADMTTRACLFLRSLLGVKRT